MRVKWLIAASVLYLIAALAAANQLGDGIKSLKPNELGDLIAGVFSPLAFSWFVAAVWMQRTELSLQRLELSMQRDEMKGSRAALEQTSNYASKQAEALLEQARILASERQSAELNDSLKQISVLANNTFGHHSGGSGDSAYVIYRNGIFVINQYKDIIDSKNYNLFFEILINLFDDLINEIYKNTKAKVSVYGVSLKNVDIFISQSISIYEVNKNSDAFKVTLMNLHKLTEKIITARNENVFGATDAYPFSKLSQ